MFICVVFMIFMYIKQRYISAIFSALYFVFLIFIAVDFDWQEKSGRNWYYKNDKKQICFFI